MGVRARRRRAGSGWQPAWAGSVRLSACSLSWPHPGSRQLQVTCEPAARRRAASWKVHSCSASLDSEYALCALKPRSCFRLGWVRFAVGGRARTRSLLQWPPSHCLQVTPDH